MADAKVAKEKQVKALSPGKMRKQAREALSIGRWIARRRKKKLDPEALKELNLVNESLAAALRARDDAAARANGEHLAELLSGKLKPLRPSELWWNVKWILVWVSVALLVRIMGCELFSIPSGSMLPTLQVGDRVVVSKASFGLRVPFTYNPARKVWDGRNVRRGEVVVFMHPNIPERDMVKRVIGIGGDTLRFKDGRIWVKKKGEAEFSPIARAEKGKHQYCDYDPASDAWGMEEAASFEERHGDATYITLGRSEPGPASFHDALQHTLRRTTEKVTATEDTFGPIPDGHAFMVGDNREHSEDSRYWGTVPYVYMKGPAMFDLFSWGGDVKDKCAVTSAWMFWNNLRWNRLFKGID